MVVAALAQGKAQLGGWVAAETGQEGHEDGYSAPAGTCTGGRAGTGAIGAVVFVILGGAVVEEPLDAAEACAILHRTLQGT